MAEERRGEFDGYRADRAIAEIRRALEAARGSVAVHGYNVAECGAAAVAEAIETPSLFGAHTLLVVRGVEGLDERANERLADALDRQAPQVTLAVVARAVDARRRFFARCRERARLVAVDHPRTGEMPRWADALARERERRLDEGARALLIDSVGRDLLLLASELDKLAAAVPAARPIAVTDVLRVSCGGREHGSFELADAVCARAGATATRLLAASLAEGTHPVVIVGALASSLRLILACAEQVERGRTVEQALRESGAGTYQRRAVQQALRVYRATEVRAALTRLADIDVASKTGTGDARSLLEDWVLTACRRTHAARSGTSGSRAR